MTKKTMRAGADESSAVPGTPEGIKVIHPDTDAASSVEHPLFTGPVTMQSLVTGQDGCKAFDMFMVNFAPGVRNKFHTHDADQILLVTSGKGFIVTEEEKREIGPGDVIFIPAGLKHWHGAQAGTAFSHIALLPPKSEMEQLEE